MNKISPEICIVFNSGAAGDFLASLLHQQIYNNQHQIEIDSQGKVTNQISSDFKDTCKLFYETNFDKSVFDNLTLTSTVCNTHYCHSELLNMFPECKFYYIDDFDHLAITTNAFIKKRAIEIYGTLQNYFLKHLRHTVPGDSSDKRQPNDDTIKKIIVIIGKKNIQSWERLGLQKINFSDILVKERCKTVLKEILTHDVKFNEDVFNNSHDSWIEQNFNIINNI
jgi:hypothetical protein